VCLCVKSSESFSFFSVFIHAQVAWASFDHRGTGFVRIDDLHAFLMKLAQPWGLPVGSTFSEFLRVCEKLDLMTWQGKVHFHDVLLAVHRVNAGIGIPRQILLSVTTRPALVHERITTKLSHNLSREVAGSAMKSAIRGSVRMVHELLTSKRKQPTDNLDLQGKGVGAGNTFAEEDVRSAMPAIVSTSTNGVVWLRSQSAVQQVRVISFATLLGAISRI
jgi:hypothetical protein